MAARSIWKGSVQLHPLMQVPIAIYKATDGYEGAVPLRVVDEETHQPFKREERNSEGKLRWTEVAAKAGATTKTHVPAVRAVEVAQGDFRVVPQDQLDAINESFADPVISIDAVLPYEAVPMEWVGETYFVKHDKNIAGAEAAVATLHATLADENKVVIGRWAQRGHENIVAIHAVGPVLMLNRILFAQECRDDTEFVITTDVDVQALDLTKQLLGGYEQPAFDHSRYEDGAVAQRAEVIEAVLAGKKVKATKKAATAEAPADLVAALKAAVGSQAKPKPAAKKKAPAKKAVKA